MNDNQNFDPITELRTFVGITLLVFSFFSRTVEVFLRRNFGERFLHYGSIFAAFLILNTAGIIFLSNPLPMGGEMSGSGLLIFSYAFFIVATIHLIRIILQNYRREFNIYSYSGGDSWGLWNWIFKEDGFFNKLLPYFIKRIAEPSLVFITGIMIAVMFDTALGLFIQFCAFALFVTMHIEYLKIRSAFLNENDAKIIAEGRAANVLNSHRLPVAQGGVPISGGHTANLQA